ncbi:MAG TPA: hypothetical protein VFZ41_10720 [Solirubrobacterales bacterium]
MNAGTEKGPPRGALAVIAVGLLATVAAWLLSTNRPLGAVALEWEKRRPIPDSPTVQIPGGGAMRIIDAGIRASEENIAGYRLFRVASVLQIDAGSSVGRARVSCRHRVPRRAIPTKTPKGIRGAFPRSSEELIKQDVPEKVIVGFNSHGVDSAAVELGDVFPVYTVRPGLVVEWPPYQLGLHRWDLGLPGGSPEEPLELGFASIWRTSVTPAATISCRIETAAGEETARTRGAL